MNVRTILWLVGMVLAAVALAQALALCVALWAGEPILPFAIPVGIGVVTAVALIRPWRRAEHALDHRSAFLAITLCWLAACALGAVPLARHDALDLSLIEALFEAVSGFTTTGATVIAGLDALPRSLLFWRSLSQWLGGMGVVLLGVAVFPVLGLGGMQLFKAEAPGPTKDKITPRIAETAKRLWYLYVGLTIADAVLLFAGGMTAFDAVCHAMTTIATGGFSTHDGSFAYWDSGWVTVVTTVFMLTSGISFALLYRAVTHGVSWSESPELRAYLGIFVAATGLIAVDLRLSDPGQFGAAEDALRHAAFQAASILSSTGFSTSDFAAWPALAQAMLFTLFLVGGMAGSTSGGLKVVRIVLLAKLALSQFFRLVHPRAFGAIKLGGRTVDDSIILAVAGLFGMWILALLFATALLSARGLDLLTALAAAAVSLGNIGPGLGGVGPGHTFASFDPIAQGILISLMILGRLEIYAVIILLTPAFWRR